MARRVITPEMYQKLLTAYREAPGNHSYAARMCGVSWRFAKRAYTTGWPEPKRQWAVPIETVVKAETAATRSTRLDATVRDYEEAAAAAERARKDAMETRRQEGLLIKQARGAGLLVSTELLKVLRGCRDLGDYLERKVKAAVRDESLSIVQGLEILARAQKLAHANADMSSLTMRMERLFMGEPEEIKALQLSSAKTEDLLAELEAIESAIKVARPGLRLVEDDSEGAVTNTLSPQQRKAAKEAS